MGVLPWLWNTSGNILAKNNYNNYEILQSIVFIGIMMVYSTLSNIPWSYYYHFVLEEKHGFNKQVFYKPLFIVKSRNFFPLDR